MTSPDHVHHLVLDPARLHADWKINTDFLPDYWSATFTITTPVELVAGLADALIRPTPDEAQPTVSEILTGRGWAHTTDDSGTQTLTSPDGIVQAEQRVSSFIGVRGWEFVAARHHGEYGPEQLLWRAYLHEDTPAHLLTHLADALSTATPVLRSRFAIDDSVHLTQGTEFAIGGEVLAAHKQRLAEARRFRPKPRLTTTPAPPALPRTATPVRPAR
ncbi:hypothetical protein GCM10010425_20410 [Streptomyces spororaveus]|uniref:DUF317 domain-containing protein n=1 Tax=Streptomyces spororaveus TaxID=284039 RepID=A0ABQ3T7A8_9ACTN|nr:DUF317 domain-containing protein [Streptomyces spororaveus]GHI76266.1 hypothetical protein Sspor_18270 [Streptomyces spororaveus]